MSCKITTFADVKLIPRPPENEYQQVIKRLGYLNLQLKSAIASVYNPAKFFIIQPLIF